MLLSSKCMNHLSKVFKAMPIPTIVLVPDAPVFTISNVNDACVNEVCPALNGKSAEDFEGLGLLEAFPDMLVSQWEVWKTLLHQVQSDGVVNQTPVFKMAGAG